MNPSFNHPVMQLSGNENEHFVWNVNDNVSVQQDGLTPFKKFYFRCWFPRNLENVVTENFRRALDSKDVVLENFSFVISNIFARKKIEAEGQASRSFCHVRFQGLFARHLSSPCFIDGEFEANKQKTTVSAQNEPFLLRTVLYENN